MNEKQKKMKLQNKRSASAALLAATSITYLSLCPQVEAGVTWLASDVGGNLVLSTDGGTLDTGSMSVSVHNSGSFTGGEYRHNSSALYRIDDDYRPGDSVGSISGADPWLAGSTVSLETSGDTFGFSNDTLYWNYSGTPGTITPGSITPMTTITFVGLTTSTAFGSNLDAGPVVLWTHTESGDTISVGLASVPEPSSTALLGLGGLALMLRRRR